MLWRHPCQHPWRHVSYGTRWQADVEALWSLCVCCLTCCSTRGTLVPGILRWSCSNRVERGTPNKPDSTDDITHQQTLTFTICANHITHWITVNRNKSTAVILIGSPLITLLRCLQRKWEIVFHRHWPLTFIFSALWVFISIPHVSKRALISMTTSLRTFFMSSVDRSPALVWPVLSWDTLKSWQNKYNPPSSC